LADLASAATVLTVTVLLCDERGIYKERARYRLEISSFLTGHDS